MDKPGPIARLITQNLAFSAASAERHPRPTWEMVRDLASLIDIFCLYDQVHVLGRDVNVHDAFRNWTLYGLFDSTDFIRTDFVEPHVATELVEAARGHMNAAGDGLLDDGLISSMAGLEISEVVSLLQSATDDPSVLDRGREWLQALSGTEWLHAIHFAGTSGAQSAHSSPAEATTYVVRTFLYLAYAQQRRLPLTPEVARMPLLSKVADGENALADRLLQEIRTVRGESASMRYPELRRALSPLAATVFKRCTKRDDLPKQMERLRDDLRPIRDRLRQAEWNILYGPADASDAAANDWENVFGELERSFGGEPRLVSFKGVLDFGKDTAGVVDKPASAVSWIKAFVSIPIDAIKRLTARKPIVEIHNLRRELPADGTLRSALNTLFPQAKPTN